MKPLAQGQGRGITVRTVRRPIVSSDGPEGSESQRSGGSGQQRRPRSSRPSKPSKRYREMISGAIRPGGSYVKDDEVGRQFEERILETYDPTPSTTVSTRRLSLRELLRRDGPAFAWPSLRSLCEEVVAEHFSTKVLPRLDRIMDQHHGTAEPKPRPYAMSVSAKGKFSSAKRSNSKGLLGVRRGESDDDDDFAPSEEDRREAKGGRSTTGGKRKTRTSAARAESSKARHVEQVRSGGEDEALLDAIHTQNEFLMTLIPAESALRIKATIEKSQPRLLTVEVLQRLFVTRQRIALARRLVLTAVEVESTSKSARDAALLLRALLPEEKRTTIAPSTTSMMPQLSPTQNLSTLSLTAFVRLTSVQLHSLIAASPNLQDVTLRGCLSIDAETPKALVQHCPRLRKTNFNWTSIGPEGLEQLLCARNLVTLKVAHVKGLTDVAIRKAMEQANLFGAGADPPFVPLDKLLHLKLRSTDVGLLGLGVLLGHCGHKLVSLDVGGIHMGDINVKDFVDLAMPPLQSESRPLCNTALTKLVMFSPAPYASRPELNLCDAIIVLNNKFRGLRTLKIEGRSCDWRDPFEVVSFYPLRNDDGAVLPVSTLSTSGQGRREDRERVRHFDKFAFPAGPLVEEKLMGRMGRASVGSSDMGDETGRCKLVGGTIDVSGRDLTMQLVESDRWGQLDLQCSHLLLDGCKLPSGCCWPQVGAGGSLKSASLAGSDVTQGDVDALIKLNPFLASINLNGCRGIPVAQRRNYLEHNYQRIHGVDEAQHRSAP